MRWNFRVFLAIAGLAAGTAPPAALAQNVFESLVMPGPVIAGHEKLEKECAKCHEPFSQASQKRLCLDCHKDVAADVRAKHGFHGREPEVNANGCRHCHTDHKGRSAAIAAFDRETFNHARTDFALDGAHRSVPCSGCHKPAAKFREAPGTCSGCHKDGEPHKGRLGSNCAACHETGAWTRVKPFDHGKTKFPLEGKHKSAACQACHVEERYAGLAAACVSCHGIEDVHGGRFGRKCETCHKPDTWKSIHFDHGKTKFPLRGAHAQAKCDACHRGDLYRSKVSRDCAGCHGKDDPHKGQLGNACNRCHQETGWTRKVAFDHDLTRFPLIGQHAALPCEDCHRSAAYKDTPRACETCHRDTRHEGRLGTACGGCHNPNGWAFWQFDHDRRTRFPLAGAHRGVACHACHRTRAAAKVTAPMTCFGCHADSDAHQGAFGRACEACHTATSFRQPRRPGQ